MQSGDGFAASNCGYTGAKMQNEMVLGVDVIQGGGGVPLFFGFFHVFFRFFSFFCKFFHKNFFGFFLTVFRIQYPMNLFGGCETAGNGR